MNIIKKIVFLILLAASLAVVSGCAEKKEATISNSISDPGGYAQDMVSLDKNMQNNIQDSVNKENDKINNANNETQNMNENKLISPQVSEDYKDKYAQAVIKTSLGNITVKFDAANAPITVNNFLKLANSNFYDGTKFHRVIKGFMIQGGDPNSKNANTSTWGMGGPGYKFNDELKGTEKYPQGTLAMANSGPDTNGSQFFIVTASHQAPLPASYTVFGSVVSGLDTALKIENVKTLGPPTDRPMEDVVIKSIEALEK